MAIDIDNNQRFWFIIWVLYCKKHRMNHETEDWNQIKDISEEEYTELEKHAMFEILNSGKCPVCWELCGCITPERGRCDFCSCKFKINGEKRQAEVEEL